MLPTSAIFELCCADGIFVKRLKAPLLTITCVELALGSSVLGVTKVKISPVVSNQFKSCKDKLKFPFVPLFPLIRVFCIKLPPNPKVPDDISVTPLSNSPEKLPCSTHTKLYKI